MRNLLLFGFRVTFFPATSKQPTPTLHIPLALHFSPAGGFFLKLLAACSRSITSDTYTMTESPFHSISNSLTIECRIPSFVLPFVAGSRA